MTSRGFSMFAPLFFSLLAVSPAGEFEVAPPSASATSAAVEEVCGSCTSNSFLWSWSHRFGGSCGGGGGGGGTGCYDCHAFNACHSNTQDGTCQNWHSGCAGGGEESRAQPLDKGFFQLVESAAGTNNPRAIRTIVAAHRGIVELNDDRPALQIKNCKGAIIASYQLGGAAQLRRGVAGE